MSAQQPTPKEYAALAYSLALARGQLYAVLTDKINHDELTRVVTGTSPASIARALACKESDLAIDWKKYLSQAEMDEIYGRITNGGGG
jgi:hypothetical protein